MRICFLNSAPVKHVGPDLGLWLSPKPDERTPGGRDRDEIGEQFHATVVIVSNEHWAGAQSPGKANAWLTSLYSLGGGRKGHIFQCRKRIFWLLRLSFGSQALSFGQSASFTLRGGHMLLKNREAWL